jgi:hypothetical protein
VGRDAKINARVALKFLKPFQILFKENQKEL